MAKYRHNWDLKQSWLDLLFLDRSNQGNGSRAIVAVRHTIAGNLAEKCHLLYALPYEKFHSVSRRQLPLYHHLFLSYFSSQLPSIPPFLPPSQVRCEQADENLFMDAACVATGKGRKEEGAGLVQRAVARVHGQGYRIEKAARKTNFPHNCCSFSDYFVGYYLPKSSNSVHRSQSWLV